jgi:hypothetical protein
MDPVAVYVPRCVQNGSESLELKTLEDFDFGIEDCAPYGFECCFVWEGFVSLIVLIFRAANASDSFLG